MYAKLAAPGWSVKKQSVYKPLYLFDGVLLAETYYCLQLYSNQVGFFNKCFLTTAFSQHFGNYRVSHIEVCKVNKL